VFENVVLMRIFGSKREEVTGGWRKLRNHKVHNMYSVGQLNIITIIHLDNMSLTGSVARVE
jgi:hypothetical protein